MSKQVDLPSPNESAALSPIIVTGPYLAFPHTWQITFSARNVLLNVVASRRPHYPRNVWETTAVTGSPFVTVSNHFRGEDYNQRGEFALFEATETIIGEPRVTPWNDPLEDCCRVAIRWSYNLNMDTGRLKYRRPVISVINGGARWNAGDPFCPRDVEIEAYDGQPEYQLIWRDWTGTPADQPATQ
ncbi:hypothetical protein E5Q_02015 [Mixia osmundae IAM 14324]|uniref:Uncharacterized protein n=1 Tax=Mixia osmundae (strain CBS 9802 / IAM 14324 / JCM 22182 / KY 12970) TaxID=764103 RepID=G7DXP8_MIXOS|nr:hypothetical protein E5Q_02015 [Mixia osmundae IAM 14324]